MHLAIFGVTSSRAPITAWGSAPFRRLPKFKRAAFPLALIMHPAETDLFGGFFAIRD